MSDPIADYDALEAINTKRTAAGLSPFMELKEAEAWDESQKDEQARAEEAAKQAELKVEAEKKPEDGLIVHIVQSAKGFGFGFCPFDNHLLIFHKC